ncbi:hypothetical protein MMC28_004026 [Mycoblastus sanguinarius]|nr:hypothetical protein [Mycoblastus sanguinarius]
MAALVPLSYFSASVFCSLTALNVSQPYRPALLVSLIASGLLAFRRLTDVSSSPEAASVLGLFVLIYLSHMSSVLCLEKYRLPKESTDWDWKMAYKMLFNARWLGTERQAPDIRPGFDSAAISINKNDSQFLSEKEALTKQSRRRTYLFKRLFSALTIYALYHLYTQIFHTYQLLEYTDFLPSKQTYLRRLSTVTARETFIRTGLVFHFTWSAWAIFTGIHDVLALISVGVGLDDPENWPPLYGSPYQMYSLRRFWGKFWHRLVYRTYTGYGALISQKLFGFRRGSLLDKLLVNFSVFLFSGVIHALVTFQLGFQCGYWEDVMWFSLNFVAVVVEQASQAALLILFGRYARNQALGKAVGSAWVFAFFFWSLPKLEYSKVYCGTA